MIWPLEEIEIEAAQGSASGDGGFTEKRDVSLHKYIIVWFCRFPTTGESRLLVDSGLEVCGTKLDDCLLHTVHQ